MLKLHAHTFHLTAAQCNAQRELSPAMLTQLIIECATEHADILGCGFQRLQADGMAWVLSRLAFEMKRYPGIFEKFTISTWIENFNRHFSQRNFDIVATDTGETLGYARSIWVAIDLKTRRPANLENISAIAETVTDRPCPIAPPAKLRQLENPAHRREYRFRISDIDFNRHVNSARYVELMLNSLTLDDFDRNILGRFDIDYKLEAHFGDTATVSSTLTPEGVMDSEIDVDGRTVTLSRVQLIKRQTNKPNTLV